MVRGGVGMMRALGVTVVVAAMSLPASADARPRVRLFYERAPGAGTCPAGDVVRDGVIARLGYDPFAVDGDPTLSVQLRGEGRTLVARIEVRDGDGRLVGSRELVDDGAGCAELASALELALAISIDPAAEMGPRAPVPPASAAQPSRPAPQPIRSTRNEIDVSSNQMVVSHNHLGASGNESALTVWGSVTGSLGTAPELAPGLAAGAGVRQGTVSVGLEAHVTGPGSREVGMGSVSATLVSAAALACVHGGRLYGCGVARAGFLRVAGHDLVDARAASTPFVAPGVRLGVGVGVGGAAGAGAGAATGWSLGGHVELLAPLAETTIVVDDRDLWTTPDVALGVGLTLGGTL